MVPDLDPDKPDPDPVWPDLDPAISGSGSGLPGSRSGNIRIWIRLLPDLDPVAAGSKVPHGLSGPVQALAGLYENFARVCDYQPADFATSPFCKKAKTLVPLI